MARSKKQIIEDEPDDSVLDQLEEQNERCLAIRARYRENKFINNDDMEWIRVTFDRQTDKFIKALLFITKKDS